MKLFIAVFTSLFLVCSTANGQDNVVLANGEWPPYHSKKLPYYGIASRIITEAFGMEGIVVEYQFLPWKRGMLMAIDGELDGTAVWRHKASFEEDFFYSESILESQTVFFHIKSFDFDWIRFDDLKPLKIGGTIGYGYNDDYSLAEKSSEFSINRAKSDDVNFRMLLAGHIDIFPITTEVGYFILQQHFDQQERRLITHHPRSLTPVHERSLHLLLTKIESNIQLMKRFNLGLAKLKKKKKIQEYIDEFFARTDQK